MPDLDRHLLPAHPGRGSAAPSGCASAFFTVFGLPFMGAGLLVLSISQGWLPVQTRGDTPPWVLSLLSLIFFVPGLLMFVTGLLGFVKSALYRRRQAAHPREPWLADDWRPEGAVDRPRHGLPAQLALSAFLALFLTPFNYFVFLDPERSRGVPFFAQALVGVFDLILVLMLLGIVMTIVQRLRFGRARLAFGSFPFFLGQGLNVRFTPGRSLGSFRRLVFILRCVEERTETRQTRKGTSTRTVCEQVWADEVAFADSGALPDGEIPVSFRLPAGPYGTQVAGEPVRYWELEVSAETVGPDFEAIFPVPVYARP